MMKMLAIIPARGGSKGIPRKNIVELGGRPLLDWTLQAAQEAHSVSRFVVSSEDPEILEVAACWGATIPLRRPADLAADNTPGIDPILHAVEHLEAAGETFDAVLCLQPTSPFRTAAHIDAACALFQSTGCRSLVSVTRESHSPFWSYRKQDDGTLIPLLPRDDSHFQRQNLPITYRLNGALYIIRTNVLQKEKSLLLPDTLGYEMPESASLDIDTPMDLMIARMLREDHSIQ